MTESMRIRREKKTVEVMIGMYCRARHRGAAVPCEGCSGLLSYALRKIDACLFHERKPACSECRVHCYSRDMRERVRSMMRFSGPRMLLVHPVLSVLHIADRIRRPDGKGYAASAR